MPAPHGEEARVWGQGHAPHVTRSSAFNNILSNLGYILLGLLFLLIILQREINHNRALLRNDLYALVRAPAARPPGPAHAPLYSSLMLALFWVPPSPPPPPPSLTSSFSSLVPNRNVGSQNTSACSMPWAQR